jgi:hypothetical protein
MAGIREQLRYVEWKCETIGGNLIGHRRKPYSMSLNWLTDGKNIDSISSFDLVSAGVRGTLSLRHKMYRGMDKITINGLIDRGSFGRSRSRHREGTEKRKDTTKGILITDDGMCFVC